MKRNVCSVCFWLITLIYSVPVNIDFDNDILDGDDGDDGDDDDNDDGASGNNDDDDDDDNDGDDNDGGSEGASNEDAIILKMNCDAQVLRPLCPVSGSNDLISMIYDLNSSSNDQIYLWSKILGIIICLA